MAIHLDDASIDAIAAAISHTQCCFNDDDAHALHRLADSLGTDENWQAWLAVLDFGNTLIQIRKAGTVALVTLICGAIVAAVWAGAIAIIKRGAAIWPTP